MKNQIEIYQTLYHSIKITVRFENDSVWLSQQQLAILFEQTKQNISLHINNCFLEGELDKSSTVKEFLTVQTEGKRQVKRDIAHYNLDLIIYIHHSFYFQVYHIWYVIKICLYLTLNASRLRLRSIRGIFY